MKFNTADEAFIYIESFLNLERNQSFTSEKYNLEKMYELCNYFDNPQDSFHSIHIAGSKGKGSTATFAASILNANGIKTGLYASPHVSSYKERISLGGKFFEEELYINTIEVLFNEIKPENYTTFELLTILSFILFKKAGCEWAVFETGLGGRLDSTNVILPEASILTLIELEHTDILGKTIKEIASQKAGIIKNKRPVFSASQNKIAKEVITKKADDFSCNLFFLDEIIDSFVTIEPFDGICQTAKIKTKKNIEYIIELNIPGSFQIENAALAISCIEYLANQKIDLFPKGFNPTKGLNKVKLPGRCEIIKKRITNTIIPFFLDVAHTVQSIKAASTTFCEIFKDNKIKPILIFGAISGKDIDGMSKILLCDFFNIIISKPGNFKANNPKEVYEIFKSNSTSKNNIQLIEDPKAAITAACHFSEPIFVTGSFYMVAEIRRLLL